MTSRMKPEKKGPIDTDSPMFIATTLMLILCWTTVCCRCYVKKVLLNTFHIDDWLIVFTLLALTSTAGLGYYMMSVGLGFHTADLPIENVATLAMVNQSSRAIPQNIEY